MQQILTRFDCDIDNFVDLYEVLQTQINKIDLIEKYFDEKNSFCIIERSVRMLCIDNNYNITAGLNHRNFLLYFCSKTEVLIPFLFKLKKEIKLGENDRIEKMKKMERKFFDCLIFTIGNIILKMSVEKFIGFYSALTSKRKSWVFNKYCRYIFKILNDESKLREFIGGIGEKETNTFVKLLEAKVIEGEFLNDDQVDFKPILKSFNNFISTGRGFYFKLLQKDPECYSLIPNEIKNNRRFVFCAYVYASNIISYLPNDYKKENDLDFDHCIIFLEDFFENVKHLHDGLLLKKAFEILLPYLDLYIKTPDDINEFFNRCSDHQCAILSSINGVHKFFVEQLSLCSIDFLCIPVIFENACFLLDKRSCFAL